MDDPRRWIIARICLFLFLGALCLVYFDVEVPKILLGLLAGAAAIATAAGY